MLTNELTNFYYSLKLDPTEINAFYIPYTNTLSMYKNILNIFPYLMKYYNCMLYMLLNY